MTEPMVDDALVARIAQVLYNLTMPPLARDWEQEARGVREWYEKQARAAIAIAYPAGVAAGREEVSAAIREVRLAEAAYAEGKSGAVDRLDAALKALFAYESAAIRQMGEG
jgi:hypothetical protein